jgi:hypothetical protein
MLTQIILLPVLYFIVADVDRLLVHAEPAVASISPQPGGRKFIRLPDLEFPLHINAYCGAGRTPESISVSIADSNKTISGEVAKILAARTCLFLYRSIRRYELPRARSPRSPSGAFA